MLGTSSGGRFPGRILPAMTFEPSRPSPATSGPSQSGSELANTLKQTQAMLAASTRAFSALVKHHAQLVMGAERLEAAYCRQAEGLLQAKQFMDGAMPMLQAVARGDQRLFQQEKEHIRERGVLMNFEDEQEAMVKSYRDARGFRDEVFTDSDHADGDRIFRHDDDLSRVPPALLEWYRASLEVKDPVEWFSTLHASYDDTAVTNKGKAKEDRVDYGDLRV